MPNNGYNRNSPGERYQPSTYVPQPPTCGNKSTYSRMTSQQRDERFDKLHTKKKKILNTSYLKYKKTSSRIIIYPAVRDILDSSSL